ncbi:MAG: hypothetical protein JO296_12765 [Pseudonocardiales bacterium]|nr:hypothetical protein [Pseudonocardiales bacterium]
MSPRPWLDCLAAVVLLRRIIALASEAPSLSDTELVNRLVALARCAP